jgi:hypothetical protein
MPPAPQEERCFSSFFFCPVEKRGRKKIELPNSAENKVD